MEIRIQSYAHALMPLRVAENMLIRRAGHADVSDMNYIPTSIRQQGGG
jgi:hypothetical protein